MVKIKRWIGRTGNNLFQYAAARLLAEKNGLHLSTIWPFTDFIEVYPDQNGIIVNSKPILIKDTAAQSSDPDVDLLSGYFKGQSVEMEGYFQNVHYYNIHRDKIRSWFKLPDQQRNTHDWVIHYRVSDYWCKQVDSVIRPDWHERILYANDFFNPLCKKKCYIVTEDANDEAVKILLSRLDGRGQIVSSNPKDDFNFIRSFDNIIIGNSSFSWWAAFLGTPKKLYTFKKWMRYCPLNLAYIDGANVTDGEYAHDQDRSNMDIKQYWKEKGWA